MTRQLGWILALAVTAAGCASSGGGGRPPVQPPPVDPHATLALVATDNGQPVDGARFDVQFTETEDDGRTNADGYVSIAAPIGQEFVVEVTAGGYQTWSSVVSLTGNLQIHAHLERIGQVTGGAPWPGRLSLATGDRCFVDGGGGCQLPVFAHFGEAFSAFVRDPARVEAQLRAIKAAGYDGIRFWDTLGFYPVWTGREVMPWGFRNRDGRTVDATPGYYERLREFLSLLKTIGLTAHHSRGDLNGQTSARVTEHTERVAQLYDEVGWEVLALAEGNNEDWQNGAFGPDGLYRIVAPFSRRGALVALSCPPNSSEEAIDIRRYSADVFYAHGHRTGASTDRIRHIFSLWREKAEMTPRLGWQGEPTGPGPGVTVGRVDDPEELAWLAAQSLLSKQAWVYMSSHGVFFNGAIESQPGFAAVPRVRDALEAFAPDLMAWTLTHGGASNAVLRSPSGYFGDAGVREGPARIDQAIGPDGRFVALVYGGAGHKRVRNDSGRALDIDVLSVGDGEQLETNRVRLEPGASLSLDYRVGRLLLGRVP